MTPSPSHAVTHTRSFPVEQPRPYGAFSQSDQPSKSQSTQPFSTPWVFTEHNWGTRVHSHLYPAIRSQNQKITSHDEEATSFNSIIHSRCLTRIATGDSLHEKRTANIQNADSWPRQLKFPHPTGSHTRVRNASIRDVHF